MSLKRNLALIVMKIFQIFPINKNKIVFSSFHGKKYNDIPRKLSDILLEKGKWKIVWIVDDEIDVPKRIKKVKPESLLELFELATSKYWVDNARKSSWIRKKKKQIYFQTWHGPVCLKAIEADAPLLHPNYIEKAKNDSKMIDYLVSQCDWRTRNFQKCFWYSGKILKGFTDEPISKDVNDKVREYYNLREDDKIILYAPTFRSSNDVKSYDIDFSALKEVLERKFGGNWIVLFRLHPNIAHLFNSIPKCEYVINACDYQKIEDLIFVSDLLITDYSGCMFQAIKSEKNVILYASDYEEYTKMERSLYFDLSNFPAPLCKNNQELIDTVINFDRDKYLVNIRKLNDFLGYYNESALTQIVEIITNISKAGGKR